MMDLAEALRPPSAEDVDHALTRFAADVRRHFGKRLIDLVLFGSRARGDHRAESDVDVAVILDPARPPLRADRDLLSDLSYDRIVEDGVEIQAWPISETAWSMPDTHPNPSLIRAIRRDGRPLGRER